MKSCEKHVDKKSEYYIHTPEEEGKDLFLYLLQCGCFFYQPGYSLKRSSFNSFLIGYIVNGSLIITLPSFHGTVHAREAFIIDCYQEHAYKANVACECLWCHFDGNTARSFYERITNAHGNIITPSYPDDFYNVLNRIYNSFAIKGNVLSPLLSLQITTLLTELLITPSCAPAISRSYHTVLEAQNYIRLHFSETISVDDIATHVSLSPFYFTHIFKKQTGMSPYQYLVKTRINSAKYLLKNSSLSVKEICYSCGFSYESVFCNAFRQCEGLTPNQYRNS